MCQAQSKPPFRDVTGSLRSPCPVSCSPWTLGRGWGPGSFLPLYAYLFRPALPSNPANVRGGSWVLPPGLLPGGAEAAFPGWVEALSQGSGHRPSPEALQGWVKEAAAPSVSRCDVPPITGCTPAPPSRPPPSCVHPRYLSLPTSCLSTWPITIRKRHIGYQPHPRPLLTTGQPPHPPQQKERTAGPPPPPVSSSLKSRNTELPEGSGPGLLQLHRLPPTNISGAKVRAGNWGIRG